jgi:50S ribosomal subunit-associated GTPase HflX
VDAFRSTLEEVSSPEWVTALRRTYSDAAAVSALTGEGIDELRRRSPPDYGRPRRRIKRPLGVFRFGGGEPPKDDREQP